MDGLDCGKRTIVGLINYLKIFIFLPTGNSQSSICCCWIFVWSSVAAQVTLFTASTEYPPPSSPVSEVMPQGPVCWGADNWIYRRKSSPGIASKMLPKGFMDNEISREEITLNTNFLAIQMDGERLPNKFRKLNSVLYFVPLNCVSVLLLISHHLIVLYISSLKIGQ